MKLTMATLLLIFITAQLSSTAQQTYHLDTQKSKLNWNSGEVGHHFGHLSFTSGTLVFSPAGNPVGGNFVINMKTVKSTDNPIEAKNLKTDSTMAKPDFFDIARYPEATIALIAISKITGSDNYQVKANLTIKGITNPIVLTAAIDRKDNIVNVSAEIDIDRSLWAIDSKRTTPSTDFLLPPLSKSVKGQVPVSLKLVLTK